MDTLIHLQRLDLGDNQITKLEGLKTLTELRSLSLGANPITWPEGLSEDSSSEEVVAYCQGNFPPQGPLPRPTMVDETALLRKFKDILIISQEVRKAEVAEYLGLTEKDLFANLVSWGALNLGFKVRGDVIVVDDLDAFVKALDQQFKQWEEGKGSKESKV